MVPNVEDVDEVIVGKRYSVPVIVRQWDGPKRLTVVPVIGTLHEDAEHINFPDRHWHPDRRFICEAWFKSVGREGNHWKAIFVPYPVNPWTGKAPSKPLVVDGGRKVLVCKRLVGSFVEPPGALLAPCPPFWLKTMETAYKDVRLRNMICPHRGISCVGVKPEADGGIVCPGHGLKWNPETGELISRVGNDSRQKSLLP